MQVKIIEPIAPDIVLFGLILVNFGPLIILPDINPPMSEATQLNNNAKIIIFNCTKLVKKKNIKQKKNT